MKNIETLVGAEIESIFENVLDKGCVESSEYKAGTEQATKLLDRIIEMKKIETETSIKDKQMELEREKMKLERRKTIVDNVVKTLQVGVTLAAAIIPGVISLKNNRETLKAYNWAVDKSLLIEFEGNEIITSEVSKQGFRNLLSPKKF